MSNQQNSIRLRAIAHLPSKHGADGRVASFWGTPHIALIFDAPPEADPSAPSLVRIHSRCATGESLGSLRCDCAAQLDHALNEMAREGGVLVYMDDEGRGIGLSAKVHAYQEQDAGLDTFAANVAIGRGDDERDFADAAGILEALGVNRVRLMTANPEKVASLRSSGIAVVQIVDSPIDKESLSDEGRRYLQAKRVRELRKEPEHVL